MSLLCRSRLLDFVQANLGHDMHPLHFGQIYYILCPQQRPAKEANLGYGVATYNYLQKAVRICVCVHRFVAAKVATMITIKKWNPYWWWWVAAVLDCTIWYVLRKIKSPARGHIHYSAGCPGAHRLWSWTSFDQLRFEKKRPTCGWQQLENSLLGVFSSGVFKGLHRAAAPFYVIPFYVILKTLLHSDPRQLEIGCGADCCKMHSVTRGTCLSSVWCD